jgi:hypothetical protein
VYISPWCWAALNVELSGWLSAWYLSIFSVDWVRQRGRAREVRESRVSERIKPSQSDGWCDKRWKRSRLAEWRTRPMNCGREGSCPHQSSRGERGDGSLRPQQFACGLQQWTRECGHELCVCVCVWRDTGSPNRVNVANAHPVRVCGACVERGLERQGG